MADFPTITAKAGPTPIADGGIVPLRLDRQASLVVTTSHGKYSEAAIRGNLFLASTQAAQATSVALATTYTGLCLSNPAGSPVNIVLLQVGAVITTGQVAISSVGLIGAFSSTQVTHTTPGTPRSTYLGKGAGYGLVDTAATIPTPVWLMQYGGSFTAGALGSHTPHIIEVDGSICLPPSSFVCIGSLTALSGFFSMLWEEVPV